MKVEAAAVLAPQSGKKGKREAEETPEKQVAAKRQKKDSVAEAIVKKKVQAKTRKKKKYETSSSSDDSSDSDYICESTLLVDDSSDSGYELAPVKKRLAVAKNGSVPAKKTKQARNSDSSGSSSDEDLSSDEEAPARNKNPAVATKAAVETDSSSDSSSDNDVSIETITRYNARLTRYDDDFDEDICSDEDEEISKPSKKGPAPVTEKESSDRSLDEHKSPQKVTLPTCAAKNVPSERAKAKTDSSSSSSEEESDEEDVKKAIACFYSSRQAGRNLAVSLDFSCERAMETILSRKVEKVSLEQYSSKDSINLLVRMRAELHTCSLSVDLSKPKAVFLDGPGHGRGGWRWLWGEFCDGPDSGRSDEWSGGTDGGCLGGRHQVVDLVVGRGPSLFV
ncbi:hypothetical protein V6N13_117286 [Hibiscus sabdariffa]|uniref:Uncharacterized protein n=1 Tax=Hibiscus sabdariffa TaxID=183260 RepID=A0ABR2PAG8_9ROSI